MKTIKTEDAVGHVLCHDITQIIKDEKKDAVFRKGHIVEEKDIPVLLSLGKDNLYVFEKDENMMHENEAALVLYDICADKTVMHPSEIKEGKIDIFSDIDGLFKVDKKRLFAVNSQGQMMIASRHGNTYVKKGDKLAGTRIIPLVIEKEKMLKAQKAAQGAPIFRIMPLKRKKAAVIATGNEVFYGRIKDTFTDTIKEKLAEFSADVIYKAVCPDNDEIITKECLKAVENGAEMVFCTGGMSVDPDDRTPLAIKNTGARIVSYGSPVLPGAMLLISYLNDIPIIGLPGCVMYSKRTVFDIVLPRLLADDIITENELALLGEGGLCLNCENCVYPNCGFGKGR